MPYLLNKGYAGLEGKVGFVYGSLCFAMNVAAYFLVPEMKGRSLEEIDHMFEMKVPLRKFASAQLSQLSKVAAEDAAEEVVDKSSRES